MSMRQRILPRIAAGVLVLFLGLQLIRMPMENHGEAEGPQSFAAVLHPPVKVLRFLRDSCYDCHSNHSRYPWYAHVQPFGWLVAKHVREGRRSLNLSEFGTLGHNAQAQRLEYILDATNEGDMPYWTYRILHPDSTPSPQQMAAITGWMKETIATFETKNAAKSPRGGAESPGK
jgi:hypothetical protein